MSNPIEDLGKIMDERMKSTVRGNTGIVAELGIININMSLSVSSLGNAIPKGDYMISLHLQNSAMELNTSESTADTDTVSLTTDTADDHDHSIQGHKHTVNAHRHKVTLPNKLRGLKAGDRVLVVWVGTEPVVVDILISS